MRALPGLRSSSIALSLIACLSLHRLVADEKRVTLPDPIAVKVEEVYHLPFFCVQEGLQEGRGFKPQSAAGARPGDACTATATTKLKTNPKAPRAILVPPANADDVATKLQPQVPATGAGSATVTAAAAATGTATATATGTGPTAPTEFLLTATDDKRSIIVFCKARRCDGLKGIEKAIDALAKPKYSYFKDYPIDSEKTGASLAKAIPAINPNLSAELISASVIRVESAKPLSDADLGVFADRMKKDLAAIVAAPAPDDDKVSKDLDGASPDVEATPVDLPYYCQSNSLDTPPTLAKKDSCPDGTRRLRANNIEPVVAAVTSALGTASKLKLSKDGNRILIACDTKCTDDALGIVKATIAATARLVPQFVMDINVARGTSSIAAYALNSAPISAVRITDTTVRLSSETPVPPDDLETRLERVIEAGFGSTEVPPLQRIFYLSAPDVVGDLLSTPPPGTPAVLGGNAATAPVTSSAAPTASSTTAATPAAASTPAGTTTSESSGTNISITNNPPAAATPSAPAPGPAPTGTVGQGMTAVDDNIVFTDTTSSSAVWQKIRLLTMLDLPRPEVIMNMWSLQASSPNGREIADSIQKLRDQVSANNEALQHSLSYGWAYLSRQIKDPKSFFDSAFYNYLTQSFVADVDACDARGASSPGCIRISDDQRRQWGFCPAGQYCLGYSDAFQPLRPTLTNIILAMIAAKDTFRTVLTTIGCMEGKFEVYGDVCFPDRNELWTQIDHPGTISPADEKQKTQTCLQDNQAAFVQDPPAGVFAKGALSCELLDYASLQARKKCGQPANVPLTCFTIQAARSFLPENAFSTFSLERLSSLAEKPMADFADQLSPQEKNYSASNLGVLRAAIADFLFNYKLTQQFPQEFGTYSLPHSAQELNAEFNPLVVAFNQDVGELSRYLMDEIQDNLPNQNSFWELWRHNKSYMANGLVTVRGISGVESLVDTDTQNSFDSTQAQTLSAVLSAISGTAASGASSPTSGVQNTITVNPDGTTTPTPPSGPSTPPTSSCTGTAAGSPLCEVAGLFRGGTTATGIATALAAIAPTSTHSIIGRQLTLDVIPHTLPGASSAELDVRLWAQEDSAPTVYSASGSTQNDFVSRVARHNVATRVRVESLKLFDVSSFSAMVQRPRAKLPIVPPFIEIPLIGDIFAIPLPAAKIYHASSAIVSAIIVPTAADLAYGLVFQTDRGVFAEDKKFSHLTYSLRRFTHEGQIPETDPIFQYHRVMLECLATHGVLAIPASDDTVSCAGLKFKDLPPER
jgi:hypothetical protein